MAGGVISGAGTFSDPYLVEDVQDFHALSSFAFISNAHFLQTNDITGVTIPFYPYTARTYTYDGNGKSIQANIKSTNCYLFASRSNNTVVKNLIIKDSILIAEGITTNANYFIGVLSIYDCVVQDSEVYGHIATIFLQTPSTSAGAYRCISLRNKVHGFRVAIGVGYRNYFCACIESEINVVGRDSRSGASGIGSLPVAHNCYASRCIIKSEHALSSVGGIQGGTGSYSSDMILNCYVVDCIMESFEKIGGIIGDGAATGSNYVRNSFSINNTYITENNNFNIARVGLSINNLVNNYATDQQSYILRGVD